MQTKKNNIPQPPLFHLQQQQKETHWPHRSKVLEYKWALSPVKVFYIYDDLGYRNVHQKGT